MDYEGMIVGGRDEEDSFEESFFCVEEALSVLVGQSDQ